MCAPQVQYNLLTPPIVWAGANQEGSRPAFAPLYHGFKEVEENWAKHCPSDAAPQPRFYCILSPEASEDDLNRLDSTVCEVLFSKTMKYDELYSALASLLAAGSQFDTLRRTENKSVTALVRTTPSGDPSPSWSRGTSLARPQWQNDRLTRR
ncbi:hypothetical protein Chor_008338 [Crotalus horridus]